MSLSIWWIRRDIRLTDNLALSAALEQSDEVLPIFVIDPNLVNSNYSGNKRLNFMFGGLKHLDADLRTKGSFLTYLEGDPLTVLSNIRDRTSADEIFAEEDFSPYARRRDRLISQELPLRLIGNPGYRHPDEIVKVDGTPYTVFSPYMRTWKKHSMTSIGKSLPSPEWINTPKLSSYEKKPEGNQSLSNDIFPPGEVYAQNQLNAFLEGDEPPIFHYGKKRDRVDQQSTSRLSPYIRMGMISVRHVISSAMNVSNKVESELTHKGIETWINELIWRDFYISILYHHPHVRKTSFRPELQTISWSNREEDFLAWCEGQTGYPIVDASMRELVTTGWMHNRNRMITASFLVKDLLIDWKWGERWFMQHLIDGDPAANNGGWQWVAGTGTDAAPYFRIFNPVLQSQKADPQGKFIRKWIPELEKVPGKYIHQPWKMPIDVQKRFSCRIGSDYPQPIVDHSWARDRALNAYRRAKY